MQFLVVRELDRSQNVKHIPVTVGGEMFATLISVAMLLLSAPSSSRAQAVPFVMDTPENCPASKPGCEGWQRQHRLLAWIKVENAERDAAAAVATGDVRLYGLNGVGPVVPEAGINGLLPNGCGLRMIEGTSDMISDEASEIKAGEYAKRYNRVVLSSTHCLSKPVTRKGMLWSSYIGDDQQNLTFGNGGYNLVFFYCQAGKIGLTQTKPIISLHDHRTEIASGQFSATAKTKITLLPRDFHRPDLVTVQAAFSPGDNVFSEFIRTGWLQISDERFDAATDKERVAIRDFIAACRQRH